MEKIKFKSNWPLVGNQPVIEFLGKSLENKNIANTYIFTGPDNLGKTTAANYFAQSLLCLKEGKTPCNNCRSCQGFLRARESKENNEQVNNLIIHSDFHLLKPDKDKKNISVAQVRDLIKMLSLSSFLNSYKIGIIKHADRLSQEAANALLKTLEEPKPKTTIILITQNIASLPLTVVSRGQIIDFQPVNLDIIYDYLIDNYSASRSQAKLFSRICLGRPALAVKFFEEKDFFNFYQEKINIFLSFLSQDINERLQSLNGIIDKKIIGPRAVALANKIIEIWQGVARDWLLIKNGQNDLTRYQSKQNDLVFNEKQLIGLDTNKIISLLYAAQKDLKANVNPNLVLENIAINI